MVVAGYINNVGTTLEEARGSVSRTSDSDGKSFIELAGGTRAEVNTGNQVNTGGHNSVRGVPRPYPRDAQFGDKGLSDAIAANPNDTVFRAFQKEPNSLKDTTLTTPPQSDWVANSQVATYKAANPNSVESGRPIIVEPSKPTTPAVTTPVVTQPAPLTTASLATTTPTVLG
jgi:hypothetical protein